MPLDQAFKIIGRPELLTKQGAADEQHYSFSDKNATFRSFITAHVKQAEDDVIQRCKDHADFWNIREECDQALEKISSWQPPQIPEDAYALVQQVDGQVLQKYAAFDTSSTFDAAVAFHQNKSRYPLSWRKEAAARLLSRAQRYGTVLPEYVEQGLYKSAGLGYPTSDSIEETLVNRLNLVSDGHERLTMKLSSVLEHLLDNSQLRYDSDFVKQAMNALEQYDAETGLSQHYGQDLELPEEMLEHTTQDLEKVAELRKQSVELSNGRTVDVSHLTKEALNAVAPGLTHLDPGELVDVLPTLPKGDADLLARLAD